MALGPDSSSYSSKPKTRSQSRKCNTTAKPEKKKYKKCVIKISSSLFPNVKQIALNSSYKKDRKDEKDKKMKKIIDNTFKIKPDLHLNPSTKSLSMCCNKRKGCRFGHKCPNKCNSKPQSTLFPSDFIKGECFTFNGKITNSSDLFENPQILKTRNSAYELDVLFAKNRQALLTSKGNFKNDNSNILCKVFEDTRLSELFKNSNTKRIIQRGNQRNKRKRSREPDKTKKTFSSKKPSKKPSNKPSKQPSKKSSKKKKDN